MTAGRYQGSIDQSGLSAGRVVVGRYYGLNNAKVEASAATKAADNR